MGYHRDTLHEVRQGNALVQIIALMRKSNAAWYFSACHS
jgi:hypothetical protein